jgi:hypothetical protein
MRLGERATQDPCAGSLFQCHSRDVSTENGDSLHQRSWVHPPGWPRSKGECREGEFSAPAIAGDRPRSSRAWLSRFDVARRYTNRSLTQHPPWSGPPRGPPAPVPAARRTARTGGRRSGRSPDSRRRHRGGRHRPPLRRTATSGNRPPGPSSRRLAATGHLDSDRPRRPEARHNRPTQPRRGPLSPETATFHLDSATDPVQPICAIIGERYTALCNRPRPDAVSGRPVVSGGVIISFN